MWRTPGSLLLFAACLGGGGTLLAQQSASSAPVLQHRESSNSVPVVISAAQATAPAAGQAPVAAPPPAAPPAAPAPAAPVLSWWQQKNLDVFAMDFGQLARYRAANAALPPPAPGEKRVIFFGDSITDFWKLDQYFPGKGYINRGIGGQTTSQMLVRFRQDVIDLKPKVLVLLAGTNDIAGNTGPITLPDIEANYATLAELARLHGVQVVFSSITPVNNYTALAKPLFDQRPIPEILELNEWMKTYAAANDAIYLDYYPALVDDKGMLRANLANDGLHPNDAGYKIMAPLAQAAIDKALAK